MSGISDPPPSDGPVGPARRPAAVVAAVTGAALVTALANDLPMPLKLTLAFLVLIGGGLAVRRLLQPALEGLSVNERGVRIRESGAVPVRGALLGKPFVSPVYVGFRWRLADGKWPRSFGIFRGQMREEDYRRLCVSLRQRSEP